ncbi:MAG TPA: peptide deformylase [bacterium]
MTVDDIRVYGDPVLRKKAARVEVFDEEFKALVEEMFQIMFVADGIGLAAPQVNISKAFLVIGMPRENQDPEKLLFVNPEILEARGEGCFEEGCLSLPGIREEIVRPEWIRLRFQDIEGQVKEVETDGLLARVLQHEMDHLEGILLVDRLSPARRSLLRNELKKLVEQSRQRLEKERASQTAA